MTGVRQNQKLKAFSGYLLQKLGTLLLVFISASAILFTAVNFVPGDPISLRLKNPDPERVAAIRKELGLDAPLLHQYLHYTINFLRGKWGESLITGQKVSEEINEYFPATMELALIALILGVTLGLIAALCAQWFKFSLWRNTALALGALGLTVPIFWLGLMLIVVGSLWMGWFPTGGRFDYAMPLPRGSGFLLFDSLASGRFDMFQVACHHLALPVCCLALYPAALVCGVLQARLEDPRIQELVSALKAKGLAGWQIWFKHILRLLGAAVITVVGTNFGALLGGAVLTESVFSWPGMGRYLVGAVLNRDLYVIENGLLLVILLAYLSITLADVLAFLANPTVKQNNDP